MNFTSSLKAIMSKCLRMYHPQTRRFHAFRNALTINTSHIRRASLPCRIVSAIILTESLFLHVGVFMSFANTDISYICISVRGLILKLKFPTLILTGCSFKVSAIFFLFSVFIVKTNKKAVRLGFSPYLTACMLDYFLFRFVNFIFYIF